MHPDDLEKVNDFFDTIIFNNQHQPLVQTVAASRYTIARRGIFGTFTFARFMFMFVGANLLTTILDPFVTPYKQPVEQIVFVTNMPKFITAEQQNHQHDEMTFAQNLLWKNFTSELKDFGCHQNICRRSCFVEEDEKRKPWCFASPKTFDRKYSKCTSTVDCSPLWECLETCHL